MSQYKNILIGYRNPDENKPGKFYISIANVSDQPIVIEPGAKIYLNETPSFVLQKNPKTPHYTKSVRVEEDQYTQDVSDIDPPF